MIFIFYATKFLIQETFLLTFNLKYAKKIKLYFYPQKYCNKNITHLYISIFIFKYIWTESQSPYITFTWNCLINYWITFTSFPTEFKNTSYTRNVEPTIYFSMVTYEFPILEKTEKKYLSRVTFVFTKTRNVLIISLNTACL